MYIQYKLLFKINTSLIKKLYIFFLENESDDVFVMSNYKNSMELFIFYKIFQIRYCFFLAKYKIQITYNLISGQQI